MDAARRLTHEWILGHLVSRFDASLFMCVYCKYGFGLAYYGRSQENLGIIEVREINPAFIPGQKIEIGLFMTEYALNAQSSARIVNIRLDLLDDS